MVVEGERPNYAYQSSDALDFLPLDKVFIRPTSSSPQMEGPYLILEKIDSGQYLLCDEDENVVRGGQLFAPSELISYWDATSTTS